MTNRKIVGAVLLVLFGLTVASEAAADIWSLSREFQAGWDRFATRLIEAASDQESLSSDPAEDVRRAALPAEERGALRALDTECFVSPADLGACPSRSPPAA